MLRSRLWSKPLIKLPGIEQTEIILSGLSEYCPHGFWFSLTEFALCVEALAHKTECIPFLLKCICMLKQQTYSQQYYK